MATAAKVIVRGLSKRFQSRERETEVLQGIDFDVHDGEFVTIVGPSGCGKTTLLRILDGLEPMTEGSLEVAGKQVTAPGPDRGLVFQQDGLYPWRTVVGNIGFGLELQGVDKRTAAFRALDMVNLVGLEGFEKYYPHELSGGMRQRVNIARALAIDPEVLLMDEPFAALDAQTRESMQRELLQIWSKSRKTVVFITHQIDEAVYLADRVIVLAARPGRVREIIPIELPRPRSLELKRTPEFNAYVDYINKLIH